MKAIRTEPTVKEVAHELALAAYETQNTTAYVKDALARITRAQAADTLREAIAQAAPEAARRRRDETLTKAVEDLTPAFDRMIADLTVAAQKLDPENPVDIGNAIRDDTTRELKIAQHAVDSLGAFAAIHISAASGNLPAPLADVLPVLDLPDCKVEQIANSIAGQTLNNEELGGTRTVRDLARDLERGVDGTLVRIARGAYPGVTFTLHDHASYATTLGHARQAFARKRATAEQTQQANREVATR